MTRYSTSHSDPSVGVRVVTETVVRMKQDVRGTRIFMWVACDMEVFTVEIHGAQVSIWNLLIRKDMNEGYYFMYAFHVRIERYCVLSFRV